MNDTAGLRKVLNVGSGPAENGRLHKAFMNDNWKELRFDIDERVKPDFVGSIQNMRGLVKDAMFDAVWSSHNLEHLHTHEVVPALREFRRILKPDGFAFVTCPDLAAITALIAEKGVRTTAYISPAGPITPSDMLYGHARSIAAGNTFMCHNTGFDAAALAADALDAGFKEARIANGAAFDLWAILTMPDTDLDLVKGWLAGTPEAFLI